MIDRTKYLYWFNPEDEQFEKDIVWREMYSRIGYVFHLVQMVEYNIANILALEEYEKKKGKPFTLKGISELQSAIDLKYEELSGLTFGQLAGHVKNSAYLQELDLEHLERIVEYRNYLAHSCFKEKLFSGGLQTLEGVDLFIDDLNEYESMLRTMNDWLIGVFEKNKLKSISLTLRP